MFTLGMYGAELMAVTVSGGMGLVPVGGTVVPLPQLAGAFQLVAGAVTSRNLLFQVEEVTMFCTLGKEMGAPTGNRLYDSVWEITEMASMQFAVYGLMNPYTYQRPKITQLPNETGLTVLGGRGVAVVPNGIGSAVKPPYLPGQYPEYPAAVQGWAQQALPGGSNTIGMAGASAFNYGSQIKVSDQKMYQQGQHYNKHGKDMGFGSKKEYEEGARSFVENNKTVADIFEGKWNSSRGSQSGEIQIIIRWEGKQAIINKETGKIIDFYEGTSLDGFIEIRKGTVMKIEDGDIIPAVRIGNIRLDITKKELVDFIGADFREQFRENDSVIEIENAKFWIASDGKVDQIGVGGDFKGKYKGVIGLGSTLKDVKAYIGDYVNVYDTYEMEVDKGICFELEDIDDWDEFTAPIEYIYVFRVKE